MKYKKRARPILVIAPGIIAGAEKVVQTGSTALADIGLDPVVVIIKESQTPHFAEQFEKILNPNVKRITVDTKRSLDLMLPMRIKEGLNKILDKDKPGPLVFHSHGFKALFASSFIKGSNHHIHTHHGNTGLTLKIKLYEKLAYSFMKNCDRIIAVSQRMKEDLLNELYPYKNISVIDNMLSFKNIAKIRDRRNALPQRQNDIIRLLFVGRLSPEKGLLEFLHCWSNLIYRDRFELTIVGDGPLKHEIENFLKGHHLMNRVKLCGYINDPAEYFIESDLLIMPSLTEGLPMTLIESLAAGLPVLANDVGAIASLVVHGHNGYLCSTPTEEKWTTGLWEALKNIESWKSNAQWEASSVEIRFSPTKWAVKTQAFYQV
jgi:glycosyltransferase involved in cell wall biosynthesis